MKILSALVLLTPFFVQAADESVKTYTEVIPVASHQYNPPARIDIEGWFVAHADLLWLTAQEEGLIYVIRDRAPVRLSTVTIPLPQNGKVKTVDINFQPGFRVKLTNNLSHDAWDAALNWTHYWNSTKSKTSANQVNNSLFATKNILNGNYVSNARGEWDLRYDTLDLELGRSFWMGNYFSLHPVLAIRSGWIKQHFDVTYSNLISGTGGANNLIATKYTIKNKNYFWGIGPMGELDLRFAFNCNWSLYGHGAIALLWGFFEVADEEINFHPIPTTGRRFTGVVPIIDVKDKITTLKANAELSLGIQWDHYFSNDLYHLGFHLGWEYHLWFETSQLINPVINYQYDNPAGDFSLSGLVFGADFNF